jgi:predicted nucleic acid-binding protein
MRCHVLVDSNLLMYSSGAGHPNKLPATHLLKRVAAGEIEAIVDAEVLQEIIHRYRALHRWNEGQQVYALARKLFPEVLAITGSVMGGAKKLADEAATISARGAVHAAVVATYRLEGIRTFDSDFEPVAGAGA